MLNGLPAFLMYPDHLVPLIERLPQIPGVERLAERVLGLAWTAVRQQDPLFPSRGSPSFLDNPAPAELAQITPEPFRFLVEQGAASRAEIDACTAILALGTAASWPVTAEALGELARRLLWLQTHSRLDPLPALSLTVDPSHLLALAEQLTGQIEAEAVSAGEDFRALEAKVAHGWLATHPEPRIAALAPRIDPSRRGPTPHVVSGLQSGDRAPTLIGELGPRPRGPFATSLLAFTLLLFVGRFLRLLARFCLGWRAPVSLSLGTTGLELVERREILGRVLRERRTLVPAAELCRVTREVRYPRSMLYAGLAALAVGTYLGVGLFLDGLRVPGLSFPLLGMGLVLVLTGLGLDLALSGWSDSLRGRCRLLVSSRQGTAWAIGALEPGTVDSLLTDLRGRLDASTTP